MLKLKQKINNFETFAYTNFLYLFLVILNVSLLVQFIKFLLEYHPYLLELTPYNVVFILFMSSLPVVLTSILLYCAGKNTEFKTIFLRIFIAIGLVFTFGFILVYFSNITDKIILLPLVIAQWKQENLLFSTTPNGMRPDNVTTPDLSQQPRYLSENISQLSTPDFTYANGVYTISGEQALNLQGVINGTHSAQPYAAHLTRALEHSLGHSNWGSNTQVWTNMKDKFTPVTQQFMDHVFNQHNNNPSYTPLNSITLRSRISRLP